MRRLALSIAMILTALSAHATDYKQLPWKEFGTAQLMNGSTTTYVLGGAARGMYLRFFVPEACGRTSFSVAAVGKPFDPRIVYADNYYTPLGRTMYFYVGEEKDIDFDTIWLQNAKVEKGSCSVTLSFAPAPAACGKGPEVFAGGVAYSNVGAHIAKDLAWKYAVQYARAECGGMNVCKVPGKSRCSGSAHGNHWQFRCEGYFVCETTQP